MKVFEKGPNVWVDRLGHDIEKRERKRKKIRTKAEKAFSRVFENAIAAVKK